MTSLDFQCSPVLTDGQRRSADDGAQSFSLRAQNVMFCRGS